MRLRFAVCALGLLAAGHAAGAQAVRLGHAADAAAVAACLAAIPESAFARVAVHVAATPDDAEQTALLRGADLLAQGVAQRLQAIVAATHDAAGDGVPAGDALVTWRSVPGHVHVTVHRDGRLAWARGDTGTLRTADTAATVLLARALADVHTAGERVLWPDSLAGDSAAFSLALAAPTIRRDGSATLEGVRSAFPAFTLPLPWSEPVRIVTPPRIVYPDASLRGGAEGMVRLQYVVDERGRALAETIAEQWPASRPRLRGDLGRYYQAFVRTTRRGVPTGRFESARIGGCAVPQLVQQEFAYGIRR